MDAIIKVFSSTQSRVIFAFSTLALILFSLSDISVTSLLLFVFIAVFIFSLLKHIASRKSLQRRRIIKSIVGSARRIRKTFAVGWDVEILHLIVILMLLCFGLLTVFQIQHGSELFSSFTWAWCIAVPLVVAGTVDAVRIVIAMTKLTWARLTMKTFYAGVAAFSVWVGDIVAKKLVAQATGFAPDHFVATERLIHWVITPLIGLGMVVGMLSLLSLIAYILIMTCAIFMQQLQGPIRLIFIFWRRTAEKASIGYRLRHGKNWAYGAPKRLHDWDRAVSIMRPIAVITAAMAILCGLSELQAIPMNKIGPIIRDLVVLVEFNEGQRCGTTLLSEPTNHLGNGEIAIAISVEGDWSFESDVCEAVKKQPKSR